MEEELIDCSCCTLLIMRQPHIRCTDCEAYLCIQCFRMGAELGKHKRGHAYEVIDPVGRPVFEEKNSWGALEEKKMLGAAHRVKLGSWAEMAQMMQTHRGANQTQDYYDKYFIRGPVGQFGMAAVEWKHLRKRAIDSKLVRRMLEKEDLDMFLRSHIFLDALRYWDDDIPSIHDQNLDSKIKEVLDNYIDKIENEELPSELTSTYHTQAEKDRGTEIAQLIVSYSDDEMDPEPKECSQDVTYMGKEIEKKMMVTPRSSKKITFAVPSTPGASDKKEKDSYVSEMGLEPERETSDEEDNWKSDDCLPRSGKLCDTPKAPTICVKKTKERGGRIRIVSELREKRVDGEASTSKDCTNASGEVQDESEEGETSYDDLHGLDKEDSSSSDDERDTVKHMSNGPISGKRGSKKKRRSKVKSKKMRRLETFEKMMAKKAREQEKQLEEAAEVVSRERMARLRKLNPKLCLDKPRANYETRIRLRQDDVSMLCFNFDRDEFEMESFNDAEQLISRLLLWPMQQKHHLLNIEEDVKIARIQKYIRALCLRNARKRAIGEHDKISEFFNFMLTMTVEKRTASEVLEDRPKKEQILERCQQTLTRYQYRKMIFHIERMEGLMERIQKLQELQRQGVTSAKEYRQWEQQIKRRVKKKTLDKETRKKAGLRWKAIQRWHKSVHGY